MNKIDFAWPSTSEHASVLQFFDHEIDVLRDRLAGKRIVIFGAGIRGCNLLHILQEKGYTDIVFADNNLAKHGGCIGRYDIMSLDEILTYNAPQFILISPENDQSIRKDMSAYGIREGLYWYSLAYDVYDAYCQEFLRPLNNHLLVMGDCILSHVAMQDDSRTSLAEMFRESWGKNHCKVLGMHGIGQQANYRILSALLKRGERPNKVLWLLTELAPKAHLMPRTQHPCLMEMLASISHDKELAIYASIARERYSRFMVEDFAATSSRGNANIEKMYMQMMYLFRIKENSEAVVYLKETIKLLNREKIPIVLYIPPVNYELGESFFADFQSRHESNFIRLSEFLAHDNLNYEVIDASRILSSDEFAARNTVDETANYRGRCKQLDKIKQFIILGNDAR